MSKKQKKVLYRLIIAAILLVMASLLPLTGIWKLLSITSVILVTIMFRRWLCIINP